MDKPRQSRAPLSWALLCLVGCRPALPPPEGREATTLAPTAPSPAGGWRTTREVGPGTGALVGSAVHLPPAVRRPPPPADQGPATVVGALLPTLAGATFDRTRGKGLAAAWAALDEDRRALGLAGLPLSQWNSSTAGCELPGVRSALEHDGATWEIELDVAPVMWLTERPWRDLVELSPACVEALHAHAGDVAAAVGAGCEQAEEQAFFESGSDCRACLEVDGDHARCVDEGSCRQAATRRVEFDGAWRSVVRAQALLCAPDFLGDVVLLSRDLPEDDSEPQPYDHGAFDFWCIEVWNNATEETTLACTDESEAGTTWGDALVSQVASAHPQGGDESRHTGRLSVLDAVEVEGTRFPYTVIFDSGVTALSAPQGSVPDAWGVHPLELRPDGSDPQDPTHTMAREYVAALALKIASTISGILVQPFNHNRCAEDGWTGPHADGSFACDQPGPWSTDGWLDDAMVAWYDDEGHIYPMPLLTLVSTGRPDPGLPGGLCPRVLSSTTLADPEWEACAWPETFTPDRVRLWDEQPATGGAPYASFDGQTWRFGRDAGSGDPVVLGLLTSQQRAFCPD
ncbi:hypothetical protein L6R53_07160 [Myxococcota bacterium]|nr:hypothetical protein [Myxococcota bacterium]